MVRRTPARVAGSATGAAVKASTGMIATKRASTGGSVQPHVQLGPSQQERSIGSEAEPAPPWSMLAWSMPAWLS